ncbi:MAG TPA: patatin-like phospholipase family protein [Capillimicrobium sp.]|nr:patatin-like phospholipase family protein [Capillimicrobium sp.]
MRVGLVLGAGGVVGASWLIGALEALEAETGWSPSSADRIVGTSAGSVIGTLTAARIPPAILGAYASGRSLDGYADLELAAGIEIDVEEIERDSPDRFRLAMALPPIGPGSWRMALNTLRNPLRHPPAAVIGGWLPRGVVCTSPIRRLIERFVPDGWPDGDQLRIVATDYRTGKRVCFGRKDAPEAGVADAVAASCAIPAFYHPVTIAGRRYVDGGLCSASNLDLLCGEGLDVAICLNPMSSADKVRALTPSQRLAAAMRGWSGRRLEHEVGKLEAAGTQVIVLTPTAEDLAVMGTNLMSRKRRAEVTEQAERSMARELRRRRGDLPNLTAPARRKKRGPALKAAA